MEYKHVSVFRFKPEYRKQEIINTVADLLRELPKSVPSIIHNEIGVKPIMMPTESPDGQVRFYDIIQVISFATKEDLQAYPKDAGHHAFVRSSSQYMEDVIVIDYEL